MLAEMLPEMPPAGPAALPLLRGLTQQGEPVVKVADPEAQPLGSSPAVRHQRHDSHTWHRFGFYYYSTALPLITNDGYEDP